MHTEENNPHLTAKIVVSYVRHHRLVPDQLADLITFVHRAIDQLGQPPEPDKVLTPAVSVRRSVHRDYVICLDCGYRGKTLRRHINAQHGLSRDEYRQRWGLRSNYPLTAPGYSERRSALAKSLGLGRKLAEPVAPAKRQKASPPGIEADRTSKAKRARGSRPVSKSNVASEVAAPTPATRSRSRARAASPSVLAER